MGENLYSENHKSTNEKFREGYGMTFSKKCKKCFDIMERGVLYYRCLTCGYEEKICKK